MGRGGKEWLRGKDEEVMPVLFEEMAGGKLVKQVCREQGWPLPTINLWAHSEKWRARYRAAREAQGTVMAETVLEAAESATNERDYAKIQGLRVYVDAMKWAAARHNPRMYGDKLDVTTDGRALGSGVIALPAEQEDPAQLVKVEAARAVLQAAARDATPVERAEANALLTTPAPQPTADNEG